MRRSFRHSLAVAVAVAVVAVAGTGRARAQNVTDFSAISGEWTAHGIAMDIGDDGEASASWRIYNWCSDLTQPAVCDAMIDNQVVDGGLAMLRFTSLNGSTATAVVLMSSDPGLFAPGATITMQISAGGIAQLSGTGNPLTLCGPDFNSASFSLSPCGA